MRCHLAIALEPTPSRSYFLKKNIMIYSIKRARETEVHYMRSYGLIASERAIIVLLNPVLISHFLRKLWCTKDTVDRTNDYFLPSRNGSVIH